ncbi:MAG: hypothetical protein L6W00_28105 [Lentisphaeria bacterium]|nr:MAG: hypothetical protein L6W00_28105 [Lentisphaeria bacterium]
MLYLHGKGLDFRQLRSRFQLKEQLTFSTERKFMATYGRSDVEGQMILYVKGAPEILMKRCVKRLTASGEELLTPELLSGMEGGAPFLAGAGNADARDLFPAGRTRGRRGSGGRGERARLDGICGDFRPGSAGGSPGGGVLSPRRNPGQGGDR